jgi:hypothetical protein
MRVHGHGLPRPQAKYSLPLLTGDTPAVPTLELPTKRLSISIAKAQNAVGVSSRLGAVIIRCLGKAPRSSRSPAVRCVSIARFSPGPLSTPGVIGACNRTRVSTGANVCLLTSPLRASFRRSLEQTEPRHRRRTHRGEGLGESIRGFKSAMAGKKEESRTDELPRP